VNNKVLSPTFSLVNEYSNGRPIYHFDLYRLKNIEELLDIGMSEYLDSGRYCFIEWPQMAEPLLPEETVKVIIEATGEEDRSIKIISNG
jgi:tRNA threonylcarbamoyladenosine biosynthesis protein TsaE